MTLNNNLLNDLKLISQEVGKNVCFVQGGGGNTSVKLDNKRMAIKASGWLLSDLTEKDGYSVVDYISIKNYIQNPDVDEKVFTKKIKSFVIETENRPSIETGFHAMLGECIIHTHSVYANLLTCSKEGMDISKKLFPESLWVPYAAPGRDLTLAVQKALSLKSYIPKIIFLENHGIIVSTKNAGEAIEIHDTLNKKIQEYFDLSDDDFNSSNTDELDLEFVKNHIIFPDQVVYTLAGEEMLKTKAAKETLMAYNFILKTINEKNLTPNFISREKADILLNMEGEKYRQKILKEI